MARRTPRSSRTSSRSNGRPRATVLRRPPAVGISVPKLEGADKVTGRAMYVDDLRVPGVLHGLTVRSTVPRGIVKSITLDPAFDWEGVTVADHRDVPGDNVVP